MVPLTSPAHVNVLTYHNDNARTGQNINETTLTPANVNTHTFGLLFSCAVDGRIYAQPLYMAGVAITNHGTHNVVFVATAHDSVFAFDADNNVGGNAAPLWKVSFINPAAGLTTMPGTDVSCPGLAEIGIISTPVIDPSTMTLYVVAKTKEVNHLTTNYFYRLHALDLGSGAEKFGGPVPILPVVAGTGVGNDGAGNVPFDALWHLNRSALLLANGAVYAAFASQCDLGPYHGWVLGFNAQTLQPQGVFNDTPNGQSGGVWEGGGGPATDAEGNIYVITGNGTFDGDANGDYGDSFVKLTTNGPNLYLTDYFTPSNQLYLSVTDGDVGSGGLVVLPDSVGGAAHPHLAVAADKGGTIYLVDLDDLGQYNYLNNNQIVQSLRAAVGPCLSTPAYFNNTLYFSCVGDQIKAYSISNGLLETNPSTSSLNFAGETVSVSANGTRNGIVWLVQTVPSATLYAYNATNVATEIYNSAQAGWRDELSTSVPFAVPTVANGKVYIGTAASLAVFGTFLPVLSTAIAGGQITLSWPTSPLNYVLEFTTNLAPPAKWHAASQTPVISGGQTTVTIPIRATNTFYRLSAVP